MCQNCQTPMDDRQRIDFLRRYLETQETLLRSDPDNADLGAEIERTKDLLSQVTESGTEAGCGR